MPSDVTISIDGDDVLVSGSNIQDRVSRMFFKSILGATAIDGGWRCPVRRKEKGALVVQINSFLEKRGFKPKREGPADDLVERDLERRRSFERAREYAVQLRNGAATFDEDEVLRRLRDEGWNEDARRLKDHQVAGLLHALTSVNAANFSVPGSGKTATTLALAAVHLSYETVETIVVVGPLSSFRPWETEVAHALPGKLRVRRVRGNALRRAEAYRSTQAGDLLLLSYATAARDTHYLRDLFSRLKVMLVVDESHRVKRFRGGYWAPALMDLARRARVKTILSGTPMPQSGRDLYSQLNILWPGRELTGPPDAFAVRVDADLPALLDEVRPFVSRTPKSALGLRPYDVQRHVVVLDGTEGEIYELIESNFRKLVEGAASYRDRLDALRRGRPIRLLQAATNADLLNRGDPFYGIARIEPGRTLMDRLATFGRDHVPAKSRRGLEIVREIVSNDQKVVVWSNFLSNLDQFSRLVRREIGVPCYQVDGRVRVGDEAIDDAPWREQDEESLDTREEKIEAFLTTRGGSVLVANPASCSESISLHTTCHNAIYLDRTYDCALFLQSIDRVHRLGLPPDTTVTVIILQAQYRGRGTVDDLVDASLTAKEGAMRQLLEGAELNPNHLSDDPALAAEGNEEDLERLLRYLLGEE